MRKERALDAGTPLERQSKSQGQVIWEQFRKHKAAMIGGGILIAMYLSAMFAGFLAPYGLNEYRRFPVTAFQPPVKIHWFHPETGRLTRPFIYEYSAERDPVTRQRVYIENRDGERYPIHFFVHRPDATYKVLGLFSSDLHLFGVDEPARLFLWGTNNLGKDVFSRVLYGGQVSLTIGILAVWVSLLLGLLLGGLAGFYGGRVDDFIMRLVEIFAAIPGLFLLIVLASLLRDPRNPVAQAFGLQMTSAQAIPDGGDRSRLCRLGWACQGHSRADPEHPRIRVRPSGKGARCERVAHPLAPPAPSDSELCHCSTDLRHPGVHPRRDRAISFIGLGPSEVDTASWGLLLRDATARGISIQFVPWLLIPGIPIFLAVLSWNLVGDGLRDAFDPKKRR